ncbi:MAG: DUF4178 domain-containing protein [Deltaproteobacteria bacterium]|nr:MAG: DUF4178 domain-containing protein [Deltaproteobacteria bacterium]
MELSCPSCGAVTALRNPGIAVVVCESCHTTLYREADVLRQGAESILGEPRSALATGKSGRLGDREVHLVGRLRFDHGRGYWDEWFIEDERGGFGWLVEDEKSYTLEARTPTAPELSPEAPVGTVVSHGGAEWEVRETGVARLVGLEGQLDRSLVPDTMYRYSDLGEVGGERQLLVEFDDEDRPTAFLGRSVPTALVQFTGPAPAPTEAREAETIRCASCGAPFELPATPDPVETAACPFCDALLELDHAQSLVVGKRRDRAPGFTLELGDAAELFGHRWEVCGRIQYTEGRWASHEYLLFHPTAGYLWLEHDDGHWLFSRRAPTGPALRALAGNYWGDEVDCGEKVYKLASHGSGYVDYVDGAFPWRVRLQDAHEYWLLVRPPYTFTVEKSGTDDGGEIEHFEGSWLETGELMAKFGKSPEWTVERHPAMPNPYAPWLGTAVIAALLVVINLVAALGTAVSGQEIASFHVLSNETDASSPIFRIEPGTRTLGVTFEAPVDNSWVYLDAELVDAEEEEVEAAFGEEVGYYHGVEGGESWSEGSRSSHRVFRAVEPGAYRLFISAEDDRPVRTHVTIRVNDQLARYNLALVVLFAIVAAYVFVRYFVFERERYGETFEIEWDD